MKNEKWKIYRGVTIVELLVYIGLLSIFMLVLLDVFTTILNAKLESESTSAISQDSRYILSKLSYDSVNASLLTVLSPSRLVVGSNTYNWDGNNLTLNSARLNGLDTKIDSIVFTKIGKTVKVVFKIESLVSLPSGNQTEIIETTLGPRP